MSMTVVAYAVHVDGALFDDPQVSAWCEDLTDAAGMLKRVEGFFDDDGAEMPLLTIVRAEFTDGEWATVTQKGWAFA
jgi:hypothetical protein